MAEIRPDTRVGRLWEDVKSFYKAKGVTEQELKKQIDQGYMSDPLGLRKYKNIKGVIEGPEVLKWCYARKDCEPLLRKHKFPLFTSMSDGDPDQWLDDQQSYSIQMDISKIKRKSGGSKEKLGRRIFKWSLKDMQFNGDCPFELGGWAALIASCGLCSESTSALYFPYEQAGLKPEFYFEEDWDPSMKWQDRNDNTNSMMDDHVLLGIPLGKNTVFVDRINEEYGGVHKHAQRISRMAYEALLLTNAASDAARNEDAGAVKELLEIQGEMLPDDIIAYLNRIQSYASQGLADEVRELMGKVEELFPDHPATPVVVRLTELMNDDLLNELSDHDSEFAKRLEELRRVSPQQASRLQVFVSRMLLMFIVVKTSEVKGIIKTGNKDDPRLKLFNKIVATAIRQLVDTLKDNPNAVKAYLGLMFLLDNYSDMIFGMASIIAEEGEGLLELYPDHTPIHYLTASAYMLASIQRKPAEGANFLRSAVSHLEEVTKLEPDHCKAYLRLGVVHAGLGEYEKAASYLKETKRVKKGKMPDDYYKLKLGVAVNSCDEEAMRELFDELAEDRPADGIDLVVDYLEKNVNMSFSGKANTHDEVKKALEGNLFLKFGPILLKMLAPYPRAQSAREIIRVKLLIFRTVIFGPQEWLDGKDAIKEMEGPHVKKGLMESLEAIDQWLTHHIQGEDLLDWMTETLEEIRGSFPPGFDEKFISIYVELVQDYVALGKKEKGGRLWKRMLEIDNTKAVVYYIARVTNVKYPSIECYIDALDLTYENRRVIAPELLRTVRRAYEEILPTLKDNDVLSKRVKKKIKALKRY